MPETLSKALLNRLLRSEIVRGHMQDFYLLSGMDVLLLDPFGNPLLSWPRQTAQRLPRLLRSTAAGFRLLNRSRQELLAGLEGEVPSASRSYGLREIAYRICMEEQTVGFWLLSAHRDPKTGTEDAEAAWKEQAKEGGALSWTEWKHAWELAPSFSPEQARIWRRWLEKAAAEALHHLERVALPDAGSRALPAPVRQACEWVREHHTETLLLRDLAARAGISSEHLSRLFHKSTGMRFREYLAETRLNHACSLLAESQDRIADIAAAVGFSTLSRFNQAFRSHTGLTPRVWRRRQDQGKPRP